MQNSKCGDYRSFISMLSLEEGILLASLGPSGVKIAISVLEDASDFSVNSQTARHIDAILKPLKTGQPIEEFDPDEAIWLLEKMDQQLLAVMSSAPDNRLMQSPVFSQLPDSSPAFDPKFRNWMDGSGLDGEALAWFYKRVKFRRNLYGFLLLIPPLGLLILPFWMRAVYLTKAIRFRSFDIDFIFLIIMGQIIKRTNWGMGLNDWKAPVLTLSALTLTGFLLFLLISGGIREIPIIKDGQLPADIPASWKDACLWPTNSQYIANEDLEGSSKEEITLIRSKLYIRYGCSFQNKKIQSYFLSQDWYAPDPDLLAINLSVEMFNGYERSNLDTILSYERTMGWRQ